MLAAYISDQEFVYLSIQSTRYCSKARSYAAEGEPSRLTTSAPANRCIIKKKEGLFKTNTLYVKKKKGGPGAERRGESEKYPTLVDLYLKKAC